MSPRSLRDDLRDHYVSEELPPETLARLVEMTETVPPPQRQTLFTPLLAAAAALVLALLLILPSFGPEENPLILKVAQEIAMNHNKGLDVEFSTEDYAELRRSMDKLDFALVEAQRLQGLQLVGGRYCSIQGHLAAQLSLRDHDGNPLTLYQTLLAEDLEDLTGEEIKTQGLHIELWGEDGVFLGLARTP